jgi:hypothetical protein
MWDNFGAKGWNFASGCFFVISSFFRIQAKWMEFCKQYYWFLCEKDGILKKDEISNRQPFAKFQPCGWDYMKNGQDNVKKDKILFLPPISLTFLRPDTFLILAFPRRIQGFGLFFRSSCAQSRFVVSHCALPCRGSVVPCGHYLMVVPLSCVVVSKWERILIFFRKVSLISHISHLTWNVTAATQAGESTEPPYQTMANKMNVSCRCCGVNCSGLCCRDEAGSIPFKVCCRWEDERSASLFFDTFLTGSVAVVSLSCWHYLIVVSVSCLICSVAFSRFVSHRVKTQLCKTVTYPWILKGDDSRVKSVPSNHHTQAFFLLPATQTITSNQQHRCCHCLPCHLNTM